MHTSVGYSYQVYGTDRVRDYMILNKQIDFKQ